MISLKDQDSINVSKKASELQAVLGLCFSDNYSSTGRSMLVKYDMDKGECITKEVESEYKSNTTKPRPGWRRQPDWLVWNGFFY